MPAGHQGLDPLDVLRGEGTCRAARHDRRVPQHPRPDRGGQNPQPAHLKARRVGAAVAELSAFGEREVIEAVRVRPQLAGGPGQRLGYPRPERVLQGRHHLMTDPGPGEADVAVVRVLPGRQAEVGADGGGGRAAKAEQRTAVRVSPGGHPGQRPGARSAGQPEQDGLGLVVQGVPEQDRRGAAGPGRSVESGVPGRSRGGLRPGCGAGRRDPHLDAVDRVEPELAEQGRHVGGPFC